MIQITKIEHNEISKEIRNELKDYDDFEYYQVIKNNFILGYFIVYDNNFHRINKYIHPINETFENLNKEEIFKTISTYFNKPLQVMIDSNEREIINVLNQVGFSLKRQSFEREFKIFDMKPVDEVKLIELKMFQKNSKHYDEASLIAFNHYVKTHKNVSPLTATLEQFKKILPDHVVCQVVDDKIINLCFIEKNELCYLSSINEEAFKEFSVSVIKYMLSKHEAITFEVDSTDILGMKFKSLFKDDSSDSFDTYIFKE